MPRQEANPENSTATIVCPLVQPALTGYPLDLGQWHGPVPLPPEKSLESLPTSLAGKDREMFLNFVQCFLSWLPEERLTTLQAYCHPWLRGDKS